MEDRNYSFINSLLIYLRNSIDGYLTNRMEQPELSDLIFYTLNRTAGSNSTKKSAMDRIDVLCRSQLVLLAASNTELGDCIVEVEFKHQLGNVFITLDNGSDYQNEVH